MTLLYFLEPGHTWTYCVLLRNLRSGCSQSVTVLCNLSTRGYPWTVQCNLAARGYPWTRARSCFTAQIEEDVSAKCHTFMGTRFSPRQSTELRQKTQILSSFFCSSIHTPQLLLSQFLALNKSGFKLCLIDNIYCSLNFIFCAETKTRKGYL